MRYNTCSEVEEQLIKLTYHLQVYPPQMNLEEATQ